MSCNGCRVLRKGCSDNCILRQSLCAIETPQAQANATLFVAKFFGRAGLMSFLSSVPQLQRPTLFQSLLFEACGRTVNPVNGAVGLLWTGNWHVCESAVETVLRGGTLNAMPELFSVDGSESTPVMMESGNESEAFNFMEDDRRSSGGGGSNYDQWMEEKMMKVTSSDVSETTTLESSTHSDCSETKLLRLFL